MSREDGLPGPALAFAAVAALACGATWKRRARLASSRLGSLNELIPPVDEEVWGALQKIGLNPRPMNEIQVRALMEEGRLVNREGREVPHFTIYQLSSSSRKGRSIKPPGRLLSGSVGSPPVFSVAYDEKTDGGYPVYWVESDRLPYGAWRIPEGVLFEEDFEEEGDE